MVARRLAVAMLCGLLTGGCFAGAPPPASPSGGAGASDTLEGWHPVSPRTVDFPAGTPASITDAGPRRLVLVNFWASWCGPCKTEVPLLAQLGRRGHVRVLGVSRDVRPEYASAALRKAGAGYPDVVDQDGSYMATYAGLIPVNGVPTSVLVRNGRAVAVHAGPFDGWKDLVGGVTTYGAA